MKNASFKSNMSILATIAFGVLSLLYLRDVLDVSGMSEDMLFYLTEVVAFVGLLVITICFAKGKINGIMHLGFLMWILGELCGILIWLWNGGFMYSVLSGAELYLEYRLQILCIVPDVLELLAAISCANIVLNVAKDKYKGNVWFLPAVLFALSCIIGFLVAKMYGENWILSALYTAPSNLIFFALQLLAFIAFGIWVYQIKYVKENLQ